MPERSRVYKVALSEVDRITVRLTTDKSAVVQFSAQYETLIRGKWHKLTRYDNAHGAPHRHVYRPDGTQYRQNIPSSSNQAFTEAIISIRQSFMSIKLSYILSKDGKEKT